MPYKSRQSKRRQSPRAAVVRNGLPDLKMTGQKGAR